ncbi:hypothetical protein JKF63_04852 [Porcisia hertigi]|uniref:Uncharacterized protein n=1 Tax=Porcisia hertigi TaxID=2761500 RepID=A0A836IRR5_9TRYP|nr:hypothetical protein JKF63_04852 [Porcisia hertigi]
MLPPVPCSLNPQRGGVGSLCDTSGDIGETSLTMFASMSCLPRKPPKGCAGLHSRYVPPLSHWKASDMSSSSTGGTTSAPATDGATIALSQHMTPRSHRITTTQPGNDGSVNANASGVGHIHFQEVSPTHSSMQLHSSTLKRLSFTGTGQQPLVQADDSSLNFTGPRRHVESFYTGTPGNDSLRRSFFFPSSSPGHAAVATEVAINGAALARKFSAAGSILADSYCSPTLLDAPEFPSASHPPQWQEPSYPLPSRLQHSLQITPATPARAVPPPGPHRNAVSQGLQVASHHEAPPDIGQPPDASSVPGMDRRPLHPSDWRSLSVAVASASEAGRNTALLETSLVSPTLARSQWRCRFEESFSSAEEAFQSADARAQMPASAAAAPAAGGGRGGVRARLTSLTSSSRLTQSPAYILDWERSLAAFKDRAERYYSFKGICTETYLTLIEHSVDRFLVCYFSGGSGTIRPEDAVQVALASHTGSATRATPHVLGDTSAGNSDVRGSSSPGPGGKGIQKMLQGSKTLQKLSETGSKWLVRMGANLRRTGAVVTSVPSEPKTSLMSTTSPVSQNPLTFGDTRASLQRGVEGTIPGCKMTPTSTSATVAASAAMGIRVPDTTYASLYGDDPLDLRSALGPPPEQPHAPVINGSAPSKSTSQLSLTLSVHQEVSAGMDCSASTPDTIFPSCVSPEEAEIQCLLQLGHYVADVIPDTFMDTRPSDSVIHQVRCNYAILLYTLQHILRDSSIRSRQGSVSDSFCTDGAPSLSFALTQTLRPTSSTTVRGPLPLTVDELVCQRIRYGLLLPTIQTTWRDFLAPLEAKVQELVQIASTNIDPILGELQAACDKEADIDAATAVSPASLANPGSGVRPDSTAVAAALVRGKTLPFREITETERAAREALRAAWEGPLARLIRLLRKDEEYLSTIHTMDDEFVENGTAWHLRSAQMRMCCTALSDYVPVYGLVLSRLHRLEMEHRTVLELWGGSGAAVTAGRQ